MMKPFSILLLAFLLSHSLFAQTKSCQAELLVSNEFTAIGKKTADSLHLHDRVSLLSSILRSDQLIKDVLVRNKKPAQTSNIVQVGKYLKIDSDKKTGIIVIDFRHPDTVFALRFMDTLVKRIPYAYFENAFGELEKKRDLLDREIDLAYQQLKETEEALVQSKQLYGIIDVDFETKALMDMLASVIKEKDRLKALMEIYKEMESKIMAHQLDKPGLLAWADHLPTQQLFVEKLTGYAKKMESDPNFSPAEMETELLSYLKESNNILKQRMRQCEEKTMDVRQKLQNLEKNAPLLAGMKSKLKASQKVYDQLVDRKTRLSLINAETSLLDIRLLRSPRTTGK